MASKTVKLGDFAAMLRRDMKTLERRTLDAVRATVADGVEVVQARAPSAFGDLAQGIEARHTEKGGEIHSTAPHSVAVEHGRRPGGKMPPLEPIEAWVRLKGIGEGGPNTPRQIAFLIARKIAEEGIPPNPFMGGSIPDLEKILDAKLEAEFSKPLE